MNKFKLTRVFLLAVAVFFSLQHEAFAKQASSFEKEAESFIADLGDEALRILKRKKGISYVKREFDTLFQKNFAISHIARFTLGKYWRRATDEQKREFVDLFRRTTLDTYTSRLQEYGNEKFKVTGSKKLNYSTVMVDSDVIQATGRPLGIQWRVLKGAYNGRTQYRIADVSIAGVSQAVTQRSEYASIISRKGIDGLIADLKRKVK